MKLRVMLPSEVLIETEAVKVVAEAQNGLFCLLPLHVDFTARSHSRPLHLSDAGG